MRQNSHQLLILMYVPSQSCLGLNRQFRIDLRGFNLLTIQKLEKCLQPIYGHNPLLPHRIDRYSPQFVSKGDNFITPIKDYAADKITTYLPLQFFQPFKVILINSVSAFNFDCR